MGGKTKQIRSIFVTLKIPQRVVFQCKISDSVNVRLGLNIFTWHCTIAYLYASFFMVKKKCNWTGELIFKKDCDLDLHTWSLAVKSLGRICKASIAAVNLILHVSFQILRLWLSLFSLRRWWREQKCCSSALPLPTLRSQVTGKHI